MKKLAGRIGYRYKPTKEDVAKSKKFSEDMDATIQYGNRRNQNNPEARIFQGTISKLAEIACSVWIREQKKEITKDVDWNIYKEKNKNWTSDIVALNKKKKEFKFSIKVSPIKYGGITEYLDGKPIVDKDNAPIPLNKQYTYTIQLSNNDGVGGKDTGDHNYYLLCNWDEDAKEIEIHAWLDAEVVPKMLIRPFSSKLKTIKGCIMMETCGGQRDFPCGIDELIKRQNGT